MPLYQQKAIKTGRMGHQDTKLTSMRPRLKELNDIPYIANKRDCEEPRSRHGDTLGFIRSWRRPIVRLRLTPDATTLFALFHSRHITDVGEPPRADNVAALSPSTDGQTDCLGAADA